jgi:ketosteroid isomerase-like protein
MGGPTPSLAAEKQVLRDAYAALNRGDVPGFVKDFDPQIERVEHLPQGVSCRGLAAVVAHVSEARGTWAEGSCEPRRLVVAPAVPGGDRIVVLVQVRVRLKAETEWREGRVADVFTFRDGKVVEFRTFGDEREGLEWAGIGGESGGTNQPARAS